VKRSYHTINKQGKANEKKLAEFLSKCGQLLLPIVDLIEQCRMACDELIDVAGRATIQAVLDLSAQQVAGPRQRGKPRAGDVVWYGQQSGTVMLSDRKLAASTAKQGARHGQAGGDPGLCGDARSAAARSPHVGHFDARRFHPSISKRDSRDGGHYGGFQIQRQSADD